MILCNLCNLRTDGACRCTKETREITELWATRNERDGELTNVHHTASLVATFHTTLVTGGVDENIAAGYTHRWMGQILGWEHPEDDLVDLADLDEDSE